MNPWPLFSKAFIACIVAILALALPNTPLHAGSSVTINGVVPLPDYSASSTDNSYSFGRSQSRATVNGRSLSEQGGHVYSSRSVTGPTILRDLDALPAPVWRMVMELLNASQSDSLEALRVAIEMNEMPPSFGATPADISDPVGQLRSLSSSGKDDEILKALEDILNSGFVHVGVNTPYEAYVWPYFAYYTIATLNRAQDNELRQLLSDEAYQSTMQTGQYTYFMLGISPDGIWQYFIKEQ